MVNELKNRFVFKDIWSHTKESYQKLLHLKLWAYIITRNVRVNNSAFIEDYVSAYLPWRLKTGKMVVITDGHVHMAQNEKPGLLNYEYFLSKVPEINSSKSQIHRQKPQSNLLL